MPWINKSSLIEFSQLSPNCVQKRDLKRSPGSDNGNRIAGTNEVLRIALNGKQTDWCDIVFENRKVWLEVKHSWTWHTFRNPARRNTSYRDHLFGEHDTSALRDAREKLSRLIGRPGVELVGLPIIAIDSNTLRHPKDDIECLERMAGLDQFPWRRYSRPRCASTVSGYTTIGIQPYRWLRSALLQCAELASGSAGASPSRVPST